MNYCIYLRKSRADAEAEARGEGETLARHEKALLELARRQSLTVTAIYREIVSGDTIAARPEMQRLLNDVERGAWNGVLVMDIDRLSRGSTVDQGIVAQTFKYADTRISTPGKTYSPSNEFDEEYFEFGLFMSRREYKTINRRLQRGRAASAKEGKFVGSRAPYGYRRVKLEHDKGVTLELIPEQAEVVRLIFDWYINGENGRRLGIELIARRLNELHIAPIRHDYWQKETIREMLSNPTYAGKIRWGWYKKKKRPDGTFSYARPDSWDADCTISDGLHQAIVSYDDFVRVQQLLAELPTVPVGYKSEVKNPLAGLIVCGKCNRKMVLRPGKAPKPDYIICHNRNCCNVSSQYELVEERLLTGLKLWLDDYKLTWSNSDTRSDAQLDAKRSALRTIATERDTLRRQLDNAHDLLEQGVYSTDTFLDRSAALQKRIDETAIAYAQLESELHAAGEHADTQRTIIPKVERLLTVYETLPTASAKNALLKSVLERAIYVKDKPGTYRDSAPDNFQLTIYPLLPQKSGTNSKP